MGCWNGTDMITFTPIIHRDPVRMLVLRQVGNLPWEPVGPFIKGEYDDYGRIENIEDGIGCDWLKKLIPLSDKVREEIDRFWHSEYSEIDKVIVAVERGMVHYETFDYAEFEDDVIPLEEEGYEKLNVQRPKRVKKHYCVWMIHEQTWQGMQSLDYDYYRRSIDEETEELKKFLMEGDIDRGKNAIRWNLELKLRMRHLCGNSDYNEIVKWADSENRVIEVIDALSELRKVSLGMQAIRREFSYMTGVGDQSVNHEAHARIAEITMSQCQRLRERYEEA